MGLAKVWRREGGNDEREGHPSSFDVWEPRVALVGGAGPITARLGVRSRLFSTLLYVLCYLVLFNLGTLGFSGVFSMLIGRFCVLQRSYLWLSRFLALALYEK